MAGQHRRPSHPGLGGGVQNQHRPGIPTEGRAGSGNQGHFNKAQGMARFKNLRLNIEEIERDH